MNATTSSTPEQVAEFTALLASLDVHVHQRQGWQRVRCWNRDGHKHGDRTPSLSVSVLTCGFRCHGCGVRGGLTALRRHCGKTAPTGVRPSVTALTARLARLAAPTVDVVALLPDDVLARLRERTGRHRRRHVLNKHLQTVLAAIVTTMRDAKSTRRVRFTATDALRYGIRAETWHDLLDVLPTFGIQVNRGQSGRYLSGARRGRGCGGRLLATTLTLTLTKSEYSLGDEQDGHYSRQRGVFRNGLETTLAVAVAVRAPLPTDDTPTLNRRPAVARLLMTLAMHEVDAPATGNRGHTFRPQRMELDELVALYGKTVKRTVAVAETDGLVRLDELTTDGFTLRTVALTDIGALVAERDEISGSLHLSTLAHKAEQRLADFHERLAQAERRHCERHEAAPWQWPSEARYVRTADGRLVDAVTGVVHAA